MDVHINDFYHDCTAGLLQLYQSFPCKSAVYIEDLIGRYEPDEFGLPDPRQQSCLGALLWLADEGYLRFESTIRHEAIDQAVLSEKGFARLSRAYPELLDPSACDLPPSVQRSQSTLAFLLKQALRSHDSIRLEQLARRLLALSDTV